MSTSARSWGPRQFRGIDSDISTRFPLEIVELSGF